jgi:16S rRNA (guanine527-N7)-methyltransferase
MARSTHPKEPRAAGGLLTIRGPADFAAAFGVSRETLARLETYEKLLRQWQKAVNLVAPSTLDAVWHRHFADSAQLLGLAPAPLRSWIDLGSGAGFPGLVVAILLADAGVGDVSRETSGGSAPRITLIESDTRKCAFLREVVRQTGVVVDILSTRIESPATRSKLQPPDVVSARALAPLDRLLNLAAPLSSLRTVGLFLKGREAAKEVEMAQKMWNFNSELVPSCTESGAHVVRISQLGPNRKEPRS